MHLDLKQTAPHMSLEETEGGGFRMKDHSGLEFQIYLVNSLRKDGQVLDLPPANSLRSLPGACSQHWGWCCVLFYHWPALSVSTNMLIWLKFLESRNCLKHVGFSDILSSELVRN